MAKRFTDTGKWNKPFIRSLKAPYKLLWLYILDECDHAGIWQVDIDVAQIKIGERLKQEDAIKFLGQNIYPFDGGQKWFIPSFIDFQYGDLNPDNRAHNSVINLLNKYSLLDILQAPYKDLISPLQGAMDTDKDKDKDMDKVKEGDSKGEVLQPQLYYRQFVHLKLSFQEFNNLNTEFSKAQIDSILDQIENFKGNKKYNSLYLTAKNWLKKDNQKNDTGKSTFTSNLDIVQEHVRRKHGLIPMDKGPEGPGIIPGGN